jgi:NTE family protein
MTMSIHASRANAAHRKTHRTQVRPPFECIALLLQGGGALGAYQAGGYEALADAHLDPEWVAGISIGAINSALIAGNPPETRLEKLRKFWELVTTTPLWGAAGQFATGAKLEPISDLMDQATGLAASIGAMSLTPLSSEPLAQHADRLRESWRSIATEAMSSWPSELALPAARGDLARGLANQISGNLAVARGCRVSSCRAFQSHGCSRRDRWKPPATMTAPGYDSARLKATLERLVDFDRINAAEKRFSVGAVNVGTGDFVYFDNTTDTIRAEHVMASGALPPGFPAIEIEGEHYWDGGLVSNTPLQWVLESEPRRDTLAFQVDLWSARGAFPRNMAEVTTHDKEIRYSSRTRANSDRFKSAQKLRNALSSLLQKLPVELKDGPEFGVLSRVAHHKVYNLVQLIYRSKNYEGDSKDYEFSRQSMEDHWRAGYHDTVRTLRHPEVLERPRTIEGVFTFDLAHDGRE